MSDDPYFRLPRSRGEWTVVVTVAGLLAGGIASMISVRREGKKIEELKRRRMIEE